MKNHFTKLFSRAGDWAPYAAAVIPVLFAPIANGAINLPGLQDLGGNNVTSIDQVSNSIICVVAYWMFWILIALTTLFVVVAAYRYLTSSGEPEKVSGATKMLTYAVVAVVVALLAKGFPFIVSSIFGGGGGLNTNRGC